MDYFDKNTSQIMANQQLSIEDCVLSNYIEGKIGFYYRNRLVPIEYWAELTNLMIPNIEMLPDGHARYLVSDFGRVFDRKRLIYIFPYVDSHGYVVLNIHIVGEGSKRMKVHRLVMIGFHYIKEYIEKEVNHIDGNKEDNYVENLEWCTRSENMQHAYDTGLNHRGEEHYKTWIDESDAIFICDLLTKNAPYQVIIQALKNRGVKYEGDVDENKAFYDLIYYIHHGKTWKHISARYNFHLEPPKEYIKFTDDDVHHICQIYVSGKFKNVPDILRQAGFDVDKVDEYTRNRWIQICYAIIQKKRRTKISDLYFQKGFKPDKKKG